MSAAARTAKPSARRARAVARRAREHPDLVWIVALTVLALAIRLVWVLAVKHPGAVFGDENFYVNVAESLSEGKGYKFFWQETVQWPPGYPFLLAGVFLVTGYDLTAGQIVNAILGTATVPLIYIAAKQAFGRPEAVFSAAAVAVIAGPIFFAEMLMSETLYTLLIAILILLVAVLKPTKKAAVAVGVVLGLACLTRGEGYFLVVIPLAVWWPQLRWRALAGHAAILIAVTGLMITPWLIRNASVSGNWTSVAAQGGGTLYDGHNPTATGTASWAPSREVQAAEKPGNTLAENEVARSSKARDIAIEWALSHPVEELKLIPRKLLYANRSDGYTLTRWINEPPVLNPATIDKLAVWADVTWYGIFALAICSLVLFRRRLWRNWPLLRGVLFMLALAIVLYGFVYYGNNRYRVPLEQLFVLVAAPLIGQIWRLRDRLRRVPAPAGPAEEPS